MRIERLFVQKGNLVSRLAAVVVLAIVIAAGALSANADTRPQSSLDKNVVTSNQESQSLSGLYRRWLDQDVHWIVTPQESRAYLSLKTNQERNQFIQQFWQRRNPPDAPPNTFRMEHYRRIAYTNEHFADANPGWETDRGHIYIVYGPPDSIDSHTAWDGLSKPFQVWHYHLVHEDAPATQAQGPAEYKAAVITRKNVDFKFVDACNCNEYTLQPSGSD